jgi:hypothetical protein
MNLFQIEIRCRSRRNTPSKRLLLTILFALWTAGGIILFSSAPRNVGPEKLALSALFGWWLTMGVVLLWTFMMRDLPISSPKSSDELRVRGGILLVVGLFVTIFMVVLHQYLGSSVEAFYSGLPSLKLVKISDLELSNLYQIRQTVQQLSSEQELLSSLESSGSVVAYIVSLVSGGFGAVMYYDGWKRRQRKFLCPRESRFSSRNQHYFCNFARVYLRRIYRCMLEVDFTHREIVERSRRG